MPKKHYINIAFHNYKIKCTQNQISFYFNLNSNFKLYNSDELNICIFVHAC